MGIGEILCTIGIHKNRTQEAKLRFDTDKWGTATPKPNGKLYESEESPIPYNWHRFVRKTCRRCGKKREFASFYDSGSVVD